MLRRQIGLFLLATWAVLSVAALCQFVSHDSNDPELEVLFVYELVALNFPISLILLVSTVSIPFGYLGFSDQIVYWCNFTVLGYLQWAVLFPLAWSWARQKFAKSSSPQP